MLELLNSMIVKWEIVFAPFSSSWLLWFFLHPNRTNPVAHIRGARGPLICATGLGLFGTWRNFNGSGIRLGFHEGFVHPPPQNAEVSATEPTMLCPGNELISLHFHHFYSLQPLRYLFKITSFVYPFYRKLLCEVVAVKVQLYKMLKSRNMTAEEYIKVRSILWYYLKTECFIWRHSIVMV